MNNKEIIEKLEELDACEESIEWIESNENKSFVDLWNECDRGDWLNWLTVSIGLIEEQRNASREIALDVVHLWDCPPVVLDWLKSGEENSRSAAWSAARSAAGSAARSAAGSAARSAAVSAAWSAAGSAAVSAARSAAWSAAGSAARSAALKKYADIIRKHIKIEQVIEKLEKI